MRKLLYFLSVLVFFSFSTAAVVATYSGSLEKQGPEAEFLVGYASDKKSELKFEVGEAQGLNISYNKNYSFNPGSEERFFERNGKSLPIKEFIVKVGSVDPEKKVYDIPVSVTAHPKSDGGGGISPETLQEREYIFEYHTEYSNAFEGDLIDSEEEVNSSIQKSEGNSEDSLSSQNKSKSDEVQNPEKEESGNSTLALIIAIFLVFGYTFYQVLT